MTGSNAPESTLSRRDEPSNRPREGLFHSLGSMLFRPFSWVASPRAPPSTYHSVETDHKDTAPTTSIDKRTTSNALPTLESTPNVPFHGTHTLPSSLRVTPTISHVASPRSKWGSLNLAPSQSRSFATSSVDAPVQIKPATRPESSASLVSVLGKRNPSVHLADTEHEEHVTESSSRKRRMVWDPEMGFVDVEDLAARRPPAPPPQNEAERILRALESMRTPLGDARRERIIRSQSRPSWSLSAPIPVPLPTPERESILAPPRPRSAAFRSIAPHSRSLRRSQLLRQSQVGLLPNLRSKLRQSVQYQDTQQDSMDEARVDNNLKVTEPEQHVSRTTKRRASKAKLSSKSSRAKLLKADNEVIPKASTASDVDAETTTAASLPETDLAKENKAPALQKRDKFEVRPNDEPLPKRSVLRQGPSKVNRRHAPSGRITAFDDDEDEDDVPMPSGEELAKIKLPSSLFPENFSFGDATKNPASSPPKPLLERMDPPTTTPAKEPKPGSVRFDAKPDISATERSNESLPPSSFFASAPAKSDSISTEKKSGPVPDFFGTKKLAPDSDSSAHREEATDTSMGKPAGPDTKKRDRDDEERPAKKPASTLNPTAPSFSIGKPADVKDTASPSSFFQETSSTEKKPTFSFGIAPEKKDAPTFSFAQPTQKNESQSAFSLGQIQTKQDSTTASSELTRSSDVKETACAAANSQGSETVKEKPAFSFNQSAPSAQNEKPTFSFGSLAQNNDKSSVSVSQSTETKDNQPSFSFNSAASSSTSKPSFSFGQASETSKVDKPLFSFTQPADKKESQPLFGEATEKKDNTASLGSTESTKPAFSFAQPSKSDAKPTFSFGSGSGQGTDKSTIEPSESKPKDEKPNPPIFGPSEKKDAPTFSFGQATPTFGAFAGPKSSPSFSFGQSTDSTEAKPVSTFSFGQSLKPTSDTPSFSFGQSSEKKEEKSAAPSFSFGSSTPKSDDAKPKPTFSFGSTNPPQAFGATSQAEAPKNPAESASTPNAPTMFGPPASVSGSGSTSPAPAFTFGAMPASSNSAPGSPKPSISFGAPAPTQATAPAPTVSTPSFGQPVGPPASTTSFSFGAPNPSFSFGASAPAAPAAPTTSFTFGSAPPSGVFQFGAPQPSSSNPVAPAPPTTTSFSFGAPSGSVPSFTFGNMPASPATGSPAPGFSFGTPPPNSGDGGGGGMFNLGSTTTPGGRPIKPLRQSRRRN